MFFAQIQSHNGLLAMMNGSQIAVWVAIACAVFIPMMSKRRSGVQCKRRVGWGWLVLLFVVALLLPAGKANRDRANRQAEASRQSAMQQLKQAELQMKQPGQGVGVQQQAATITIQNGALAEAQQSVVAMWDKMNEPKIKLSEDSANNPFAKQAEATSSHSVVVESHANTDDSASPESLSHSLDRLEGLARQVSAVVRDVKEVAELVGRGVIVQQEESKAGKQPMAAAGAPPVSPASAVPPVSGVPLPPGYQSSPASTAGKASASTSSPPALVQRAESEPAFTPPNWINDPPKKVGDKWREVIATDEYATQTECNREADRAMMLATFNHVQQVLGRAEYSTESDDLALKSTKDSAWYMLQRMGVGVDYINREILMEDQDGVYVVTIDHDFGPMKKVYRRLQFSESVNRDLRMRWEAVERGQRLAGIGVCTGGVMGVIGLAFGLLKVDTWTKGYYSKRLFLGAPVVIIGVVWILARTIGF